MEVYIITFQHGNYAIAAFSKLQGYGLKNIKLIQTPFSIKNECDICIKVNDRKTLDLVLNECMSKFPVSNVYSGMERNGSYVYKLLP
jgi:hypothetical protein